MDKNNFNFSNVKINVFLTPFAYLLIYLISEHLRIGQTFGFITNKSHGAAFLGSLVYIWCSRFFQPDLDHELNRPGKTTFPFGETATKATSAFLKHLYLPIFKRKNSAHYANATVYGILAPISTLWFYFWAPYATLLTHRGLSHWPIIGVLTRVYYIHFFVLTLEVMFQTKFPAITAVLESFYFWKGLSTNFVIICVPIFISDIFHSAGDGVESIIKGNSFCPPGIKRGLLSKLFRITI